MPSEITQLCLDMNTGLHRVPFAQVGCAAKYRLNIYIANPATEKIYIGLNDGVENVYFQVRDPNGAVVPGFSLAPVSSSGTGYIPNYLQASYGPKIGSTNPSGYTPLILTPLLSGNYYIEFAANVSGDGLYDKKLTYIDVSVAQNTTVIDGRLWSEAWQIYSGGGYTVTPPSTQTFAKFYIYTNDSIVSKLDLNGLCGGT
ncbi:MAG: hypothetical protein WCR72_19655, partial [Bacteroidota bacterium]